MGATKGAAHFFSTHSELSGTHAFVGTDGNGTQRWHPHVNAKRGSHETILLNALTMQQ